MTARLRSCSAASSRLGPSLLALGLAGAPACGDDAPAASAGGTATSEGTGTSGLDTTAGPDPDGTGESGDSGTGGDDSGYEWNLPPGFPAPGVPEDNPMTAEKVELGRHLFYDTRLSVTGAMSCASCHKSGGSAAGTKLVLSGSTGSDYRTVLRFVSTKHPESSALLAKASGKGHLGGSPIPKGSAKYRALEAWIADGNYAAAREVLWQRAELVIFLDLPRWRVVTQLAARTLGRVVRGTTLWNGNREHWRGAFRLDPSENVLAWSWMRYGPDRDEFHAAAADPRWSHVRFVRARSTEEALHLARWP